MQRRKLSRVLLLTILTLLLLAVACNGQGAYPGQPQDFSYNGQPPQQPPSYGNGQLPGPGNGPQSNYGSGQPSYNNGPPPQNFGNGPNPDSNFNPPPPPQTSGGNPDSGYNPQLSNFGSSNPGSYDQSQQQSSWGRQDSSNPSSQQGSGYNQPPQYYQDTTTTTTTTPTTTATTTEDPSYDPSNADTVVGRFSKRDTVQNSHFVLRPIDNGPIIIKESDIITNSTSNTTEPRPQTFPLHPQSGSPNIGSGQPQTNGKLESIVFVKPVKVDADNESSDIESSTGHPLPRRQRRDAVNKTTTTSTTTPSSESLHNFHSGQPLDKSDKVEDADSATSKPHVQGFLLLHGAVINDYDQKTFGKVTTTSTTIRPPFKRRQRNVLQSTSVDPSTSSTPRPVQLETDDLNNDKTQEENVQSITSTSRRDQHQGILFNVRHNSNSSEEVTTRKPALESLETARFNNGQSLDSESQQTTTSENSRFEQRQSFLFNLRHNPHNREQPEDAEHTTTGTTRRPAFNREQRDITTTSVTIGETSEKATTIKTDMESLETTRLNHGQSLGTEDTQTTQTLPKTVHQQNFLFNLRHRSHNREQQKDAEITTTLLNHQQQTSTAATSGESSDEETKRQPALESLETTRFNRGQSLDAQTTPTPTRLIHQQSSLFNIRHNSHNREQQDAEQATTSTTSFNRQQRDITSTAPGASTAKIITEKTNLESLTTTRFNTGQSLDAENIRREQQNSDDEDNRKSEQVEEPKGQQGALPSFGTEERESSRSNNGALSRHSTTTITSSRAQGTADEDQSTATPSGKSRRPPLVHRLKRAAGKPSTAAGGVGALGSAMRNRKGTLSHKHIPRHRTNRGPNSNSIRERRGIPPPPTPSNSTLIFPERPPQNPSPALNNTVSNRHPISSGSVRQRRQQINTHLLPFSAITANNGTVTNATTSATSDQKLSDQQQQKQISQSSEVERPQSFDSHMHNVNEDHSDFVRTSTASVPSTTTDKKFVNGSSSR